MPRTSAPTPTAFIADDSALMCERIASLLDCTGAFRIVGNAATPRDCIAAILAQQPDVVILDAQLQGGTGLEVLRAIRTAGNAAAVVVFSSNAGPAYRRRYMAEGADAFLDKTADSESLLQAARLARLARTGGGR